MALKRLFLVTSDFGGGTGTHVLGVLDRVNRARWRIEILCHGRKELEPPDHATFLEAPPGRRTDRLPLAQLRQFRQVRRLVENREDQGFSLS